MCVSVSHSMYFRTLTRGIQQAPAEAPTASRHTPSQWRSSIVTLEADRAHRRPAVPRSLQID